MSSSNPILKQLTQGKKSNKSSINLKLPALPECVKQVFQNAKPKQYIDVVIFATGIALMLKFGKTIADTIDNQMPTEKSMMDMMKNMQAGGPGMAPAPM